MYPLVSVICLCYNHEQFLEEALNSVLMQTYPNLEIIVLDDASQDNSPRILKDFCLRNPHIKLILQKQNTGNCRAFNKAFALSSGEFIIDFATDDVLLPNRITEQIESFKKLEKDFGVVYTDAYLINNTSQIIRNYYRSKNDEVIKFCPPSGDVFAEVLRRSFICPPTIMFKRIVFEDLGGYDQTLAYEDFDFWVRASRKYKFFFLNKITTKRRIHINSLSRQIYKKNDKQLASTVKICYKALHLIRTDDEKQALIIRVQSELRQAFFTQNFEEANLLFKLLIQLGKPSFFYQLLERLNKRKVNLSILRKIYYNINYK